MIHRAYSLWRRYLEAARGARRSPWSLVREAAALSRGEGRLTPSEYLDFNLQAPQLSSVDRRRFVGYRGQYVIDELTTDDYSKIVSIDKLTFDALMIGHGLPVPELLGTFDPQGRRRARGQPACHDAATLRDVLRRYRDRGIYMKAAFGDYGRTNLAIDGFDGERDEAVLRHGQRVSTSELAIRLQKNATFGVLIQEALEPHPAIAAICGPRLSGLRVQVLMRRDGPRIFRCTWKITTGSNVVDNFQHGESGNLLGAVNVATGTVVRVVAGMGQDQVVNPRHPDTGAQLQGFVIPQWDDVVRLVLRASETTPGFLVQGWDVALTPQGPVLLEVNWVGDVDLPQLASGQGWLDEEFRAFLRERDLEGLLTGALRDYRTLNPTGRRGKRKRHWSY